MERYESLGLVGEGSYGTVIKCRHRDTGRLVAIKKFMDSDSDKTVKKIALREIKLLRKLCHDNLVNLLEVWKRRRRWYLVFEFVERTLLDDLEQNPNGLNLHIARQYLYQILRAAAFCHEQNIIHRDIKPENILISQGGVVKLCDFGFARTMTSPAEGGIYTDYVATRWYRAPELLVGDIKYGKPVDVWAVGCLLLEMLTGQPLFPGDSDLDQIYHIVRCFGNLTAHHQELFYRNPVFSGVRLPECSGRVPLQERFPTITPTVLDLAQNCLQMDPQGRAQCSELLEHPLFTQDSFHIRFLAELNAMIQKDNRENSTLPKITKTPRREKDEGNDKNQRSKDKKQLGDMEEKVNKEKDKKARKEEDKMDKTKGKQPSKLSKTIGNTSEPLDTKQSKTLGAKLIDNAARTSVAIKSKPGKATGAELKNDPEVSTSVKTFTSELSEGTKTITGMTGNNQSVAAKPKHEKAASQDPREDHLKTMKNTTDIDSSYLHSSYSDTAVPSETERNVLGIWRSSKSESSQEFGKSWSNANTNVPTFSQSSTTDHPNVSSSSKASLESTVDQTGTTLAQACQPSDNDHTEVTTITIPSVNKPNKTTTTSGHQSIIAIPNTLKVSAKENRDVLESISATTKCLANQTSNVFGSSSNEQKNNNSEVESDVQSDVKCFIREPQAKLGSFSNHTRSTATVTPKTQKTTFPTEARKKSDNPERNDTTNTPSTADLTSIPCTVTPDYRTISIRNFNRHNVVTAELNEFDFSVPHSYPPPPPSSTTLLLPPPSTALIPSFSVISTNSPAISDHLTLGAGFHPGNHNLRGTDKPRLHGGIYSRLPQQPLSSHITAPIAAQVSDKSLISERSFAAVPKKKSDIHFPDLRSSVLPELRGRDGKHNKGVTKDQRKDKHLSPSEPQQLRHNSTDTHHTP